MNKRRKYRKCKSTRVWKALNPWNEECDPGDLVVHRGKLLRLVQSRGWGKRRLGELTYETIKPPKDIRKYDPGIELDLDGSLWWVWKESD